MHIKPFGWAVIGTGRIANTVMSEVTKTGRHKVVAVYSRTISKAQSFADKFNAKCFDNLKSALTCDGVEGVYIATPHSVHFTYIMKCIDLGIPILCEKSFTVNATQAIHALKYAEEKKVYLCEAMWTRFNPVVRQICEWVQSGAIGQIKSLSANFSLPVNITKPFMSNRVYLPEYAGGALLDLGVYPISYTHMLLGFPDTLSCKSRIDKGVDYNDVIAISYKNGAQCDLHCSFDKLETYVGKIIGTKGKIITPMFYKPNRATLILNNGNKQSIKCKRGYIYEFDGVASDIRNGKMQNEYISHKDTIEVMMMLDECRRQNNFKYPNNIEKL